MENSDLRKKLASIFIAVSAMLNLGIFGAALLEWWALSTLYVGLVVMIAIGIRGAVLGLWSWTDIWHAHIYDRKGF